MTFLDQLRDHGQVDPCMPQFLRLGHREHTFGDKASTLNALLVRFRTLPFLPEFLPGCEGNSKGLHWGRGSQDVFQEAGSWDREHCGGQSELAGPTPTSATEFLSHRHPSPQSPPAINHPRFLY